MGIFGYLLAGFIGFLIGVVISCILLSKRGLEMYNNVQKAGTESFGNANGIVQCLHDGNGRRRRRAAGKSGGRI